MGLSPGGKHSGCSELEVLPRPPSPPASQPTPGSIKEAETHQPAAPPQHRPGLAARILPRARPCPGTGRKALLLDPRRGESEPRCVAAWSGGPLGWGDGLSDSSGGDTNGLRSGLRLKPRDPRRAGGLGRSVGDHKREPKTGRPMTVGGSPQPSEVLTALGLSQRQTGVWSGLQPSQEGALPAPSTQGAWEGSLPPGTGPRSPAQAAPSAQDHTPRFLPPRPPAGTAQDKAKKAGPAAPLLLELRSPWFTRWRNTGLTLSLGWAGAQGPGVNSGHFLRA